MKACFGFRRKSSASSALEFTNAYDEFDVREILDSESKVANAVASSCTWYTCRVLMDGGVQVWRGVTCLTGRILQIWEESA